MTDAATKGHPAPAESSADAFRRVKALHDAGKYAEAEALLREAIARDPNNSDLRNARGVMFAAMNRHRNALAQLKYLTSAVTSHRRAIDVSGGGDALLHHNLGTSLAAAGRHGEAVI